MWGVIILHLRAKETEAQLCIRHWNPGSLVVGGVFLNVLNERLSGRHLTHPGAAWTLGVSIQEGVVALELGIIDIQMVTEIILARDSI